MIVKERRQSYCRDLDLYLVHGTKKQIRSIVIVYINVERYIKRRTMKILKIGLVVFSLVFLISCDSKMKKCNYNVYQFGRKLPSTYSEYVWLSDWCKSYSKAGVVYQLTSVDIIKVKDIKYK